MRRGRRVVRTVRGAWLGCRLRARRLLVPELRRHPPTRRKPSRGPGDCSTAVAIAEALARRGPGAWEENSAEDDGVHRERERAVGLRA
ncbi:hypothetical protein MTO96_039476 [Rhipicephalus appendiculatus]